MGTVLLAIANETLVAIVPPPPKPGAYSADTFMTSCNYAAKLPSAWLTEPQRLALALGRVLRLRIPGISLRLRVNTFTRVLRSNLIVSWWPHISGGSESVGEVTMRSTLAVFAIRVLGILAVAAVVPTAAVHSDHADVLEVFPAIEH